MNKSSIVVCGKYQKGAMALLISAVLLLGATLVTMYTAAPMRMDTQIVSNELRSIQALNAAEAGLSQIQAIFRTPANALDDAIQSLDCTTRVPIEDQNLQTVASYQIIDINGTGCVWASAFSLSNLAYMGLVNVDVTVRGFSDDGTAQRTLTQTLFLLDLGQGPGALAAMNFAGDINPDTFQAANSGAFEVNGGDGGVAAIMTGSPSDKKAVEDAIEGTGNEDNYTCSDGKTGADCIGSGGLGLPWGDPAAMADFVAAIESGTHTSYPGDHSIGGNTKISGVHVVNGDMTFSGNAGSNGPTVLVVKGNLTTQGTPAFDGIIIVLGGTYTITGGGGGGLDGSIYVANLQNDGTFGEVDLIVSGGGNAEFNYDHDKLGQARDLLSDDAKNMWDLQEFDADSIYTRGVVSGHVPGRWADF